MSATYNGLPARLDDAINHVCGAIRGLEGECGTIAQIARFIAGDSTADRSLNGPTVFYGRVRMVLHEALKVGRVERAGQRWMLTTKKRRAS